MNFLWSMLFFAAFCADFAWARAAANPFVDQQLTVKGRIIGGTNAGKGEFPWQVSLHIRGFGHFCGGAIVSKKHIVTAAHCSKYNLDALSILAGSIYRDEGIRFGVRSMTLHPGYDRRIRKVQAYDIAVWELDGYFRYFTFSEYIKPVLFGEDRVKNWWYVTVSGWGRISHSDPATPYNLKKAVLPIVSKEKCNKMYKDFTGRGIKKNTICAGGEGVDTCYGDSGSPLVKNGRLYGIVSFALGCGYLPGGYTEVAPYASWILLTISKVE
ncbi:Hypothetical predicted protein [Cloeon dipterum]|uniref:Peptidase S1 domain-containing protein n=1 Tax=Cloeon dipterum TaxID=197152 RepID=A0A8S1DRE3_9INSE|nr:Hypothetical predicted protein [Cloeon dipterum]